MQVALQPPVHGDSNTTEAEKRPARDRRVHQRVPLKLGGRFLLGDEDHPLVSINVSCGGGLFRAQTVPPQQTRVVCYLNELGRISGYVVRADGETFAVQFDATDRKRDKLADQLMWILNRDKYGFKETRAAPRFAGGKEAVVIRANGQKLNCRVLDLSVSGAAFEFTGPAPFIGDRVTAGRLHGIVVRSQSGEFAIRIVKPEAAPDESVT